MLYGAAALSFGAGISRDWIIVHRVDNYSEVFGAMYAVALAASLLVNDLSFRAQASGLGRREWSLVALSTATCMAILVASGITGWAVVALSLPMPALYVWGASTSRGLLDCGYLFISRSRDGLTSAVMALLALAGLQFASLPAATFVVGLGYALLLHRGVTRPAQPVAPAPVQARHGQGHWRWSMLYANLAFLLITLWALLVNNHGSPAFGQPASVVVRFSVYAFQVLSIPAFLVVRMDVPSRHVARLGAAAWTGAALMVLLAMLPLTIGSVMMPLVAALTMYAALTYMRGLHLIRLASP